MLQFHSLLDASLVPFFEKDAEYRRFESLINTSFRPRSAVERELIARLVSLFWRLRRVAAIEAGLFDYQGRLLQERRQELQRQLKITHPSIRVFHHLLNETTRTDASENLIGKDSDLTGQREPGSLLKLHGQREDAAVVFLRIGSQHRGVLERIARYETALCKQVDQIMLLLNLSKGNSANQQRL